MNRSATIALCCALPFLALSFWGLPQIMPPLIGYFAALAVYWVAVLIPLILWHRASLAGLWGLTWPSKWPLIANVVLMLGVTGAAVVALSTTIPPVAIILMVLAAALLNGSLEEIFWRGVMMPKGAGPIDGAIVLGFFTLWHVALLFATDVVTTGGALGLLGGAFGAGALWTWIRLETGRIGFCMASHIALNAVAFVELASHNS